MARDLVASFFVVLIVVGVPILSWQTAHNEEILSLPRPALYLSAAVSEWLLGLMAVLAVFSSGLGFQAAGFRRLPVAGFFSWAGLIAAVTIALLMVMLLLERRGWWPLESELVRLLIPETRREKLLAVMLVAPTAALCEEFIYRGALFGELLKWSHSKMFAGVISSVAFGMTHVYQKPLGMARAAALGALLAYPVARFGSLYPSVAAHFVIDAVALAWLGPRFLKGEKTVRSDTQV